VVSDGRNKSFGTDKGKMTSWVRNPPSNGEGESKTMHGKTFLWCSKCKRWTTSHGTAQHLGKQSDGKGENKPQEKKIHFSMVENYAAWNCSIGSNTCGIETRTTNLKMMNALLYEMFVVPMFLCVVFTFGIFAMMVGSTYVVECIDRLRFGLIAPIIWLIILSTFFYLQPICSRPPPPPAPNLKPLNRYQRRSLWKEMVAEYKVRTSTKRPSIIDEGFHRSYPLRLRSEGLFYRRPSKRLIVASVKHGRTPDVKQCCDVKQERQRAAYRRTQHSEGGRRMNTKKYINSLVKPARKMNSSPFDLQKFGQHCRTQRETQQRENVAPCKGKAAHDNSIDFTMESFAALSSTQKLAVSQIINE
jgi:hypothetical protein